MVVRWSEIHLFLFLWVGGSEDERKLLCMVSLTSIPLFLLSLSLMFLLLSTVAEVQACERPVIGWCESVLIGDGETGGGRVLV